MEKYNEEDNDDYLLENNLLDIETQEELEKTEALAFSLRGESLRIRLGGWHILNRNSTCCIPLEKGTAEQSGFSCMVMRVQKELNGHMKQLAETGICKR